MVQFLLEVTEMLDRTIHRKSIILLFHGSAKNFPKIEWDKRIVFFNFSHCIFCRVIGEREKKTAFHSGEKRKGARRGEKKKTKRKTRREHWGGWIGAGRRIVRRGTEDEQVLRIPWKPNLPQVQDCRILALGPTNGPSHTVCGPKSVTGLS